MEVPSRLGAHSYEVLDTKLARQVKPSVVHQLALYNRLLGDVQGREPALAHLVLGDGSEVPIELSRYGALNRHAARRLEQIVDAPAQPTYPDPVPPTATYAPSRQSAASGASETTT